MDLSDKLRRSFNVILDAVKELRIILTDKNKIKTDKGHQSRFERQIEIIGENIGRTKIRNDLFKNFKVLRNHITHQNTIDQDLIITTVEDNINELESYSENYIFNHFSTDKALKAFESFGAIGSRTDRAKMIDALFSKLTERGKNNWTKFPSNQTIQIFTTPIEEIISHPKLLKLTQENNTVATQITEEIVNWAKETYKYLNVNNPFTEEVKLFKDSKTFTSNIFFDNYERITNYLKMIYQNGEINFGFFDKKLKKLDKRLDLERIIKGELKARSRGRINYGGSLENFIESSEFNEFEKQLPFNRTNYKNYAEGKAKEILQEAESLRRNFLSDWEKQLFEKHQKYKFDEIEKSRERFTDSLYQKVEEFNKLKGLLEPFTKDLGRLWNLSKGNWQNSGFEILKKFADLLENDKTLKELAEMLGRYRKAEKEFEEIEIDKIIIKPKFKPQHASKGELIGIKESDDISNMLPIESATLINPLTRPIFLKKFAEKKLTTYDFRNQVLELDRTTVKQKVVQEKEYAKGPVIICVDTSGSMQGATEQVAKTICFALARIALLERRKCFLISFSTSIQTIDLTDLQNSLDKLVAFLRLSFNGGTDANPALEKALEMLETNDYNKADVLMISDFVMGELNKTIAANIDKAKTNKTRFHSLVISESGNSQVLKQFNHNWNYNTKGQNPNEGLIKQLKELR